MHQALLLIDIQNDYFENGTMAQHRSLEASLVAKQLLLDFRRMEKPIIHIQHIAMKPTATFFIRGTFGSEIHENVKPINTEKLIIKNYPNSFRGTELDAYLKERQIEQLVIAGMMTQMCIDTTVRAGFDLGYDILLVGEACATKQISINNEIVAAKDVQNAFLAALNGTFCKVVSIRDLQGIPS